MEPVIDTACAIERIVAFFERMSAADLPYLDRIYAGNAYFQDPFNAVRGLSAIERVFGHMYETLHDPRFLITTRIVQGRDCFLVWEFRFRFKRFDATTEQVVQGGSHLTLAPDGRILVHRDYWDAAGQLYEKLPLLGTLMRWLRRRATQ
jgi:steroid Delta-isomerase